MSLNVRSGFLARRPRNENGQVLAIVALFLIVLLGFTALAVDYGTYLLARRQYQNIADAASLAGSVHMTRPITIQDRADARTAAWESLRRQMGLTFAPSGNPPTGDTSQGAPYQESGWSIWVDVPPSAAGSDYPGSTSISGSTSVFVRVERQNPAFFARFFEIDGRQIRAWATAGNLPSRWAVIGLCPRNHPDCPANVESIVLAGTNTALRVIDGDMGSNWGFRINSNAADRLQLPGDSQAYLADITCGPSTYLCWPNPNVSDGAGTAKQVRVLPAVIDDPGYPEPTWIADTTAVPPRGNANGDASVSAGSGTVQNATGTNVGCSPTSPRIGPGRYRDIDIGANSCVIFDPNLGLTAGQRPGIFYITRDLNIGNSSFVIGDGVTIFWASGARDFNPSGGIALNTGNAGITGIPNGEWKFGGWTTKGNATWTVSDGVNPPTWVTPTGSEVGIAFYVRKSGPTITNIFNMAGTSPLMFLGVLYGPQDNINVGGAGVQAAVGQIVGWTVRYNGNTLITQTFDGPDDARSFLLEPRTGQPD